MTTLPQAESAQTSHNSNLHDIISSQETELVKLKVYLEASVFETPTLKDALFEVLMDDARKARDAGEGEALHDE